MSNNTSADFKDFIPSLRFMVVSDIHIKDEPTVERERFAAAIRDAYKIAKSSDSYNKLDAIVVVGDFANSGTEIQMRAAKQILDDNVDYNETKTILSIASHEYHGEPEMAKKRFTDIFGAPVDVHEVINGFHFISLSPSEKCRFYEEKQKWVGEQLKSAAKEDRKKPIFVFQHPHVCDTVLSSLNWGEEDLNLVYMDYPQMINFSGHSHAPINDPRSINQKHFTCLGTGTLSYFEIDEFDKPCGTFPYGKGKAAQMLIVEASEDNRVRIYPYDVITGNFFPYVWKIDTPSEPSSFIYTNERYKTDIVPYFDKNTKISFSDITPTSCKVTFSQAKIDEDYVDNYDILVRDSNGDIVKQLNIWSEYYFYDMPEELSVDITDLDPDSNYAVNIYANGFWHNKSKDCLIATFKTSK